MLLAFCDKSSIVQVMLIVKTLFKIACYIIPIIIIIVSIAHIVKSVTSGKDDELKDALKVTVKRIIGGLLIFFLPTIINYVFTGIINVSDVDFLACFESASKEKVESLKAKETQETENEKKTSEKEDEATLRKAWEEEQKKKDSKKQSFEEWKKERETNNNDNNPSNEDTGNVEVNTGGVDAQTFKDKLASMSTPTISMLESAAAQNNISTDYLKIVIGTTQNEGYANDPYLNYGWASAMLNHQVTISQMQAWDPSHSGEANFYSQTNINKGYNNASEAVLKSVYLALTERNTKIIECNGMYNETPANYNLLYKSSVYNCSIYETK